MESIVRFVSGRQRLQCLPDLRTPQVRYNIQMQHWTGPTGLPRDTAGPGSCVSSNSRCKAIAVE